MIVGVTHVALRVRDLREGEAYYRDLLDLEVAFREAETVDGWATLPPQASWDDANEELEVVLLHRDGLCLALERVDEVEGLGLLSHVGLQVDEGELRRLRGHVQPVHESTTGLIFNDRYGVRWELGTASYDEPENQSSGARFDRWLEVVA